MSNEFTREMEKEWGVSEAGLQRALSVLDYAICALDDLRDKGIRLHRPGSSAAPERRWIDSEALRNAYDELNTLIEHQGAE